MKTRRLNNQGLAKLVEYLDREAPGISKKLAIMDGKLFIDNVILTADVVAETTTVMPPENSDISTGALNAAKEISPEAAKVLSQPGVAGAQQPQQPQGGPQQQSQVVGKGTASDVKQVGRAGVEKQQMQNSEQMLTKLQQIFPDKAQLQQAFQTLAQQFAGK